MFWGIVESITTGLPDYAYFLKIFVAFLIYYLTFKLILMFVEIIIKVIKGRF